MQYLCYAMGNKSRSSLSKWIKNNGVDGRSKPRSKLLGNIGTPGLSVITSREWAGVYFSPKRMYVEDAVKNFVEANEYFSNVKDVGAERQRQGVEWDTVVSKDPGKVLIWEARRRNHLELQPGIKSDLIDQLLANTCTSYEGLAAAINYWCGKAAIRNWLESHDTYSMYRKEIKPGLTAGIVLVYSFLAPFPPLFFLFSSCPSFAGVTFYCAVSDHQKKQCALSKIVVEQNFYLPPGSKIRWIHTDEKWMKALVPRSNAKSCEELGIERDSYSVHHKCHIDQVHSK